IAPAEQRRDADPVRTLPEHAEQIAPAVIELQQFRHGGLACAARTFEAVDVIAGEEIMFAAQLLFQFRQQLVLFVEQARELGAAGLRIHARVHFSGESKGRARARSPSRRSSRSAMRWGAMA